MTGYNVGNEIKPNRHAEEEIVYVRIIETGEIAELNYFPRGATGDWAEEVIGINGGFGNLEDGLIHLSDTDDVYEATAEAVEFWREFFAGEEATDADVAALAEELSRDIGDIYDYIGERLDMRAPGQFRARAVELIEKIRTDPSLLD